ncbi:MAG: RNA polymerase sigma factor [Actinomycetota bacterium]|nr:RNA polymerase sigma factor [Actinomycetota bacterium]
MDTRERGAGLLPDFDTFFRETFLVVARAAALVARDPGAGQDVAQEAFFRLSERWHRMESAEHARRFAFRVAINLARSHVRKYLRVALAGLEPRAERVEQIPQVDEWLAIRTALSGLSPRRRAAVVLIDYVGMDAGEAGGVLGISAGTVRAHLMRGRRDMRKRLGLAEPEVAE